MIIDTIVIILAGGKGSRMKSKKVNKTALSFNGKCLLEYGLELFNQTVDKTLVIKGAYPESVECVIDDFSKKEEVEILSAIQSKRLGTGHAAQVADKYIQKNKLDPKYVFVGYGDHLMFYHQETILKMRKLCEEAAIVLVAAQVPNPFGMGRIMLDDLGEVSKIVEEKNASDEEKKVDLINAGLYCFNYELFHQKLSKLKKNELTGEYYITDLIEMAVKDKQRVLTLAIPYHEVGIGINTQEEMQDSIDLYQKLSVN